MRAETRKTGCWLGIVFGLSVLVRFVLANFYPRTVNCYPDEFLYLSLGESLWNHHNIQVFNVASSFRKVLYPLVISPAFAFADVKIRGTIIAFINAGVISLGVFPVYGLARRVLKEEKNIWLCVMLYVISPSITYSMTYMSEVVSIPLSLLLVYFIFIFWEENSPIRRMWIGVGVVFLMILCYMAKSVALVFPVALALTYLTEWTLGKDRKKRAIALVLGFVMLTGLLWFGHNILLMANIFEKGYYIIFGVLFFLTITVLGFCVILVLLPGICLGKLDENSKRLYGFLLYTVVVTAIVVTCMIYTAEDFPSLTPRAHLRYVEFLFVPFVILLLRIMEREVKQVNRWKMLVAFGVWAVILLGVFRGFLGQTVDQTMLFYWQLFADEGKNFSPVKVRLLSLVIILVIAEFIVLYYRNHQWFRRFLMTGLIVMSLGNSVLSIYVQYKTHSHSEEETVEAEQLREFVLEHSDENFLVLEPDNYCEMIDTFLVDCDNVRTGMKPVMLQVKHRFKKPLQVEYIIQCDAIYPAEEGMEYITTYPNLGYSLYRK